ncbi:hypothetical protein BEH_07835 [Priestia filamentosa]|uniref:Uncharacterized protein n=1 Tax=Priestia filamentosa TaxID=1402861 RepID=A0A0H4KI99_9BACI|nr:hypothetical protein [Priestia filamentosa]AKO92019.1 hypothetical protein BEH_07835 [Priestia filamentosa]
MQKVEIQVEESVRYEDTIQVIQPTDMSDEQFDKILNQAEKENRRFEGGAKDLASILERLGIKVVSQTFNFPESPRRSELEIIDVRDV